MKVLFINNFSGPDYLNDCIFHGLNQVDVDLEVTAYPSYMMKSYPDKSSLYGKGFTVFATLDSPVTISDDVKGKIKDHHYDLIVYGSVHRDRSYSEEVLSSYDKNDILSFDGEDHPIIYEPFVGSTTYFKRENLNGRMDVNPISFSIPKEKILNEDVTKTKLFATVVPGNPETYIFDKESDYYNDYASSYYGYTWKKAGWDCMRHYEILASGCVPAFRGLELCPPLVMKSFPKDLVLKSNLSSLKGQIHPNYGELKKELIEYTKQNLTTQKVVENILSVGVV